MKRKKASKRFSILVTAGPTVEDIDPVRFISNRSSGKLGIETAAASAAGGFRTILVHGPVATSVLARIRPAPHCEVIAVRSAADMRRAVLPPALLVDAIIMTAAIADFTPAKKSATKIKKARSGLLLKLKPTIDFFYELGQRKGRGALPVLIGFALETGSGRTPAQREAAKRSEALRKMREKNMDAVVLDSPETMGADTGDFRILLRDGSERDCAGMSKRRFARVLVNLALELAENGKRT